MNDDCPAGGLARFLSLADVAEQLGLSVRQTHALIRSGELPAIKLGTAGHWRIERSVLESYIEARYEETRRYALWNQSDFANITALSFSEF